MWKMMTDGRKRKWVFLPYEEERNHFPYTPNYHTMAVSSVMCLTWTNRPDLCINVVWGLTQSSLHFIEMRREKETFLRGIINLIRFSPLSLMIQSMWALNKREQRGRELRRKVQTACTEWFLFKCCRTGKRASSFESESKCRTVQQSSRVLWVSRNAHPRLTCHLLLARETKDDNR